jgi:hypothetical protein
MYSGDTQLESKLRHHSSWVTFLEVLLRRSRLISTLYHARGHGYLLPQTIWFIIRCYRIIGRYTLMASLNHTKIHTGTREVTASMQPCRIDNTLTTIMYSTGIPPVALGCEDAEEIWGMLHLAKCCSLLDLDTRWRRMFTSRPDRFPPGQGVLGYCI